MYEMLWLPLKPPNKLYMQLDLNFLLAFCINVMGASINQISLFKSTVVYSIFTTDGKTLKTAGHIDP